MVLAMLRPAALILALAASTLAWGEDRDGPERLAWLTYVEGTIEYQGEGERATTTLPRRPLEAGDRLATRDDSRAEISLGTAAIRVDEETEIAIRDLRAQSVRIGLSGRVANVSLYELLEEERFELVTQTATIALDAAGEYRVDFITESAITLSVRSGAATVDTAGGPIQVLTGQRVHIEGRGERAILLSARSRDDFDDWVLEREVQLAGMPPGGDDGYEQYGEWSEDPAYGRVWVSEHGYDYDDWGSYGIWMSGGYGWAWVGSNPCCGSIYGGRWVYLNHVGRWCWVPPRPTQLPTFAGETHPFGRATTGGGRASTQTVYGRGTPVTTTLGGGGQAMRSGGSTTWGSGATTIRRSGNSTMRSSSSSGSSSGSTRPFGSTSRSRSSSSASSSSSVLGGLTPP
jgi:hypothetical protein